MLEEDFDRGPPTSLRGWLSDIYVPVLLDSDDGALASLVVRLGSRATVDDPIFGRGSGIAAITKITSEQSLWLKRHAATYERLHFTSGIERDVTEGVLSLRNGEHHIRLPIAVVAERRPSREVEIRLYFSAQPIESIAPHAPDAPHALAVARGPLIATAEALVLPNDVQLHAEALKRRDVGALASGFEFEGSVRDATGTVHARESGVRAFYAPFCDTSQDANSAIELLRVGSADDGRTCALEYNRRPTQSRDAPLKAGLAVFERGDSGLLRSVRIYDDWTS